MAISVRVADLSDGPAIDKVLGECYPALFRGAYDEEALAAFLPHIIYSQPELLESGKFFVAESAESGETRILACGGWSLHRPGSREVIAGLGHLRHFAVHPDCIGKGIGRSIFEACAQQSKEFGVVEFECCSSLVAEGFYARLGLQTIETKELTLKEGVPPIPCKIMKTRDTSL
ncbi:unnamed protein product [Symbiodinium natans]|uniref:N-acetyltransferase domain-containing protein n=1 Tax=Symbiodinium natans TaxID=878477 RepID=A0A812R6U7_9DINO|nr:unnamed protein product [Symbiodinium natans]